MLSPLALAGAGTAGGAAGGFLGTALPVVGALGTMASLLAQRSVNRKLKRQQRKEQAGTVADLEANQAQLSDIQRRQRLGLADSNIGLEGGVMADKQRNLANDQKFSMDEIGRRLSLARGGLHGMESLRGLENMQSTSSIIGAGASGLASLMPQQGLGNQPVGPMMQMSGISGGGPLAMLANLFAYKKLQQQTGQ